VMKPKPLASLNHFTVPVVRISRLLIFLCGRGPVMPYVPTTVFLVINALTIGLVPTAHTKLS
jgi:hypothetical protein